MKFLLLFKTNWYIGLKPNIIDRRKYYVGTIRNGEKKYSIYITIYIIFEFKWWIIFELCLWFAALCVIIKKINVYAASIIRSFSQGFCRVWSLPMMAFDEVILLLGLYRLCWFYDNTIIIIAEVMCYGI